MTAFSKWPAPSPTYPAKTGSPATTSPRPWATGRWTARRGDPRDIPSESVSHDFQLSMVATRGVGDVFQPRRRGVSDPFLAALAANRGGDPPHDDHAGTEIHAPQHFARPLPAPANGADVRMAIRLVHTLFRSPFRRPESGAVYNLKNFHPPFTHAVRNQIRRPCHDKFPSAGNVARPAMFGMHRQRVHGFRDPL